jgi:PPOX class probable F420-dependent enzyme
MDFPDLADQRFVSLTTFRKTGERVSTAVWICRDTVVLLVLTPAESGKVKRLRQDGRVELLPCNRWGAVRDDAPRFSATASIIEERAAVERTRLLLRRKMPIEYRVVLGLERLVQRALRRPPTRRVTLRITSGDSSRASGVVAREATGTNR